MSSYLLQTRHRFRSFYLRALSSPPPPLPAFHTNEHVCRHVYGHVPQALLSPRQHLCCALVYYCTVLCGTKPASPFCYSNTHARTHARQPLFQHQPLHARLLSSPHPPQRRAHSSQSARTCAHMNTHTSNELLQAVDIHACLHCSASADCECMHVSMCGDKLAHLVCDQLRLKSRYLFFLRLELHVREPVRL